MSTLSAEQPIRPKTAAPVTAHRLFPAIVALWFAALLGIGSLVIAPETLSAVVSALGIPELIHAAAPPLGLTARGLLALAMAGIGVAIGLFIGSRIAARHTVQPQRKTDPTRGRHEKPKRTFSYNAAEHMADEPAVPAIAAQRGPLRASEAFADIEPLTDSPEAAWAAGHDDAASLSDEHFAALGAPMAEPAQADDDAIADNFDALLANSAQSHAIAPFAPPAPFTTLVEQDAERVEAPAFAAADEDRFTSDLVEPQTAPAQAESVEVAMQHPLADTAAHRALSEAPLAKLGTVQLVERLALAMAAATQARNAPTHREASLVHISETAPAAVPPTASADESPALDAFVEDAPRHELATPSVAPLAEIEPEPAMPASEPWSAPDFAEHAMSGAPAPQHAPARPSILDPIAQGWDDEAVEEDDAPTIAPPRFLSARASMPDTPQGASARATPDNRPLFGGRQSPAAAIIADDAGIVENADVDDNTADAIDDGASDANGEDRYPSLLDIQPAPREPIRVKVPEAQQAEPIVMFPNTTQRADAPFAPPPASALQSRRGLQFQGPPTSGSRTPVTPPELPSDPVDAEEADRALRAALATLQRMSGGR